ncbi:MAG: peptide deformylase [Gammaproteobacteria bacterium]
MSIQPILRMGHPLLRQVAEPVPAHAFGSPALQALIEDLVDTLADVGGIGLAAPQIGVSLRVAILQFRGGPTRYGELAPMPLTVYVNPSIEVLDASTAGYWEGCLSVPGLRGFVHRPQHIRVRAQDVTGAPFVLEPQGFAATAFQHEFDHLDGRLYVDRLTDTRQLVFESELAHHL